MVQREVTAVGTVRKGEIRSIARLCRVDALRCFLSPVAFSWQDKKNTRCYGNPLIHFYSHFFEKKMVILRCRFAEDGKEMSQNETHVHSNCFKFVH